MREEVVVHSGNAHYYPNFQNPTFLAAQKEVLRKELVLRIKMGNFEKLYPIIKNANLTEKETEEVLISWWMLEREDLIENYALALRKNNLEEIAKEDLSKESKQVEGISR